MSRVVAGALPLDRGVQRVVALVRGGGHEASAWQPGRFARMPELVALPVPSPRFVDQLRRAWDEGDAVFPWTSASPGPRRSGCSMQWRPRGSERPSDGCDSPRGRPARRAGDALVVATSGTTGSARGRRAHPRRCARLGRGDQRAGSASTRRRPLAGVPAARARRRARRWSPAPCITGTRARRCSPASTPTPSQPRRRGARSSRSSPTALAPHRPGPLPRDRARRRRAARRPSQPTS